MVNDKINNPNHYQGNNGLEAIEVIKQFAASIIGQIAVD